MGAKEFASLLGGLALFLYGMNMMSQGMEAAAGNKMKLTEANQRLKKENAQLHAIIKRQDKELHPERYIKTNKGYSL